MRVYLLRPGRKEEGPMSIEDVRDRLDLRMIGPDQPCRIAGLDGTYVAGELVTGHLFKGWEPEEDEAAGEDAELEQDDDGDLEDETDDETENEDPGDDEEDEEIEEDENESEDEEGWEDSPLWESKPGYTAFLPRVGITILLAAAAVASFFFSWPVSLSLVLAALASISLALLLGKRSGTRYSIYERRLQWSTPGFINRTRELPRSEVDAITIKRPFPGALLGRADLHLHHHHPNLPNPLVLRQVARAREARSLWR
ncbi:MAG: hypothetical protein ACKO2G_00270 [Verrucomicrobiales bacterium]